MANEMSGGAYDAIIAPLRRGDAAAALAAAEALCAGSPPDAEAQRLRALALRRLGRNAEAQAAIEQAIALRPDDSGLHLDRAALLLAQRDLAALPGALDRATELDPNQFPAYVLRAQLAIGRGDLDTVERELALARRIAPEHPHVGMLEGVLALHRGNAERARVLLTAASSQLPEDGQIRYALGFAYLALDHLGFAEAAFRSVLDGTPEALGLRVLVAELVLRQGRTEGVGELLEPLRDDTTLPAGTQRKLGQLWMALGDAEAAWPALARALAAGLRERPLYEALLAVAQARGEAGVQAARDALDAALVATPQLPDLWRARLALEPFADAAAVAVVERWQGQQPDSLDALEARGVLHDAMGEAEQAEAVLRALVERDPGRTGAETRLLEGLLQRDPAAAVARVRDLMARAPNAMVAASFGGWLGYALDKQGDYAGAAAAWADHQAWLAPQRWPLPEPSLPSADWPARAAPADDAKPFALLWGAPGAGSEVLVRMLMQAGLPVRADRFGSKVPQDLFQRDASIQALVDGTLDPAAAFAEWQAGLPPPFQPGVVEWVPFWDNALLRALRPAWPHGQAIFALRDPRAMLLDWLAYGAPAPFGMPTPMRAAGWLALVLNQIAQLDEDDLYPHRIVRLDRVREDPAPIMTDLGGALGLERIFVPDVTTLGPDRFAPDHWRHYAAALAEPFAVLAPVAHRLGYARD